MIDNNKFVSQFKEVLDIESQEIGLDLEFRNLQEWDSLALLSVIAMIDDEYDIIIKGNSFKELKTIGDIIDYINK